MSYWVEKEEEHKTEYLVSQNIYYNPYLKTEKELEEEFKKHVKKVTPWYQNVDPYSPAFRQSFLVWKGQADLGREFKRQIDSIDPELSLLVLNWCPTTISLIMFLTSIAAYPSRKKIEQLKAVLKTPDNHSDDACRAITKILLGRIPYVVTRMYVRYVRRDDPSDIARMIVGMPAPQILGKWEYDQEATNDPDDPDAPLLPPSLVSAELERRQQWKSKWEVYLESLKRRYSNLFSDDLKFDSDLPTVSYGSIRISPRLRLPSGEYLEPVVRANTVSPVGPTPSVANDTTVPVSEEKKDEKKAFPWWIVIVIGVVVLFFIMKD
jgi:hypothetical protein